MGANGVGMSAKPGCPLGPLLLLFTSPSLYVTSWTCCFQRLSEQHALQLGKGQLTAAFPFLPAFEHRITSDRRVTALRLCALLP